MAIAFLGGFAKSRGTQPVRAPASAEKAKSRRFEELVLPHLDSAYNLARWLTRSDADAQDVVQESCLRAFKYFDGFDGHYANAWLLKIVRNTCFSWIKANRPAVEAMGWDERAEEVEADAASIALNAAGLGRSPETALAEKQEARRLNRLLAELPPTYREVLILREIEDLSYREIADIVGVPIGTVMSRLARGRQSLQAAWHRSEQGSDLY